LKVLEERDLFDWFNRYRQRQRDLAAGADADLVAANRKRWKIVWFFFCLAFLLLGLAHLLKPRGVVAETISWISGVSFALGMLLAMWARAEDGFLNGPDPKKPPSLFK
jgi:hypothetical protein